MHLSVLCVFLVATLASTRAQNKEGDSCVDQYTNTVGRCKPADTCNSTRINSQQNGIRPTYCQYNAFVGVTLVCCKDEYSILHTSGTKTTPPTWSSEPDRQADTRRVSERKCEEYSKGVIETVDYIAFLPEPETMSISSAKCDYTGVELIVGGENTMQGEFPHMAAIGWENFDGGYDFKCGGSFISLKFVLTAGHCIRDPSARNPEPVIVRLGDQNIDPTVNDGAHPIDVKITKIHTHPDYKPPIHYDDIALLELESEVEPEAAIRPACLWTKTDFAGETMAVATGWGVTDTVTKKTSKELQKVSLSLLQNDFCDKLLKSSRNRHWLTGFAPSQLCAGELRGGKDTCQGDSGSPLQVAQKDNQCIFHIVGITSFGRKCAETGRPAVYTRVSSYLDWIESIAWPDES